MDTDGLQRCSREKDGVLITSVWSVSGGRRGLRYRGDSPSEVGCGFLMVRAYEGEPNVRIMYGHMTSWRIAPTMGGHYGCS